jgi:hypothetical protein
MILGLGYTNPLRGAADVELEATYDPRRRRAIATFARVPNFSLNSINLPSSRLLRTRILADQAAPDAVTMVTKKMFFSFLNANRRPLQKLVRR